MAPSRPKPAGRRSGLREDDAILGVLGGFGLVYTIFAPHGFAHPLHWVVAGVGGILGGSGVWLYVRRERIQVRLRRLRRPSPPSLGDGTSPSALRHRWRRPANRRS